MNRDPTLNTNAIPVTTDAMPLPGVLAEIAAVTDRETALVLAGEKGGNTVYLPRPAALTIGHWLVGLVGVEQAIAICRHFWFDRGESSRRGNRKGHGVPLELPKATTVHRREQVRFMSIAGAKVPAIAQTLQMTPRGVRMIRAKLRAAGEIE